MWKVLKSEYIIKRPWLTARKEQVQLANGNVMDEYYVLEYPDFVNIIAVTQCEQIVLVRQYRHAVKSEDYELPAGAIEVGETPIEAAKRELLEETGYGNGVWTYFMKSAPNPSSMTNYNHTFLAIGVEEISEPKLESTEELEVCIFNKNDLYNLLQDNKVIQSMMLAPLWKFLSEI